MDQGYQYINQALGNQHILEACNIWIGDERSITSLHQDPFENFYTVIKGCKNFVLLPPCDILYQTSVLQEKKYPNAKYIFNTQQDELIFIKDDDDDDDIKKKKTPWIDVKDINILKEKKKNSLYNLHEVTLHEGDSLYLPKLWFHWVNHSEISIAINYWYTMEFDDKFVYYNLCRQLKNLPPYGI